MRYSRTMNRRFTTWLMAVLMLVTASFAVPAVRTAESVGVARIVWVQALADSKAEASESHDFSLPRALPVTITRFAAFVSFRPSPLLDVALFQRPPPAAIRS